MLVHCSIPSAQTFSWQLVAPSAYLLGECFPNRALSCPRACCLACSSLTSILSKFLLILYSTTSESPYCSPTPSSSSKLCQCMYLSQTLCPFLYTFLIIHNYSFIYIYLSNLCLFDWMICSSGDWNQSYPQSLRPSTVPGRQQALRKFWLNEYSRSV